jgi:proteasome lid subunit RPN8/RPN11
LSAVHQRNSLSAPMIARDDHDSALNADPQSRHHFWKNLEKRLIFQNDRSNRRMIHNHPSGDPTPSSADVDMTRQVLDAARPLRIAIHDHLVVGRDGVASFKALGLM